MSDLLGNRQEFLSVEGTVAVASQAEIDSDGDPLRVKPTINTVTMESR
ncbi:MAG: hypothetical protein J2P52_01500 [Blastocatellia bacterium]|nr:hypothetical protein [Blastocatellia bacterium]